MSKGNKNTNKKRSAENKDFKKNKKQKVEEVESEDGG